MEYVDVYNRLREKQGYTKPRNEIQEGEYRLSVHIWIVNDDDEILIQKRSELEDKFPGFWAQTGGGVKAGKTSKDTVNEECYEELGITIEDDEIYYVGSYIRTRDIVDIWMVNKNVDISTLKIDKNEVEEAKLVLLDAFDKMIETGIVVPSINPSYLLLKNYLTNYRK